MAIMQWYVARDGRTTGPISEEQMVAEARAGRLAGAMVRDEHSSAWIPVEQSPFARIAPAPQTGGGVTTTQVLVVVGVGIVLALLGGFASFGGSSTKTEDRKPDTQSVVVAAEREHARALKRYLAVMSQMTTDPPVTLEDVHKALGRKPDECKRTDDQNFDVCFWFMTSDSSIKVFSYTLAADNLAGSDPSKWVKLVVFGRDGNVEKRIDGAMQQMLNAAEQ